jgi:hypothetical protein
VPILFVHNLWCIQIKYGIDLLGCDVRVYNPKGLPVRDPSLEEEPKVVELRALTHWSDGKCQLPTVCLLAHCIVN